MNANQAMMLSSLSASSTSLSSRANNCKNNRCHGLSLCCFQKSKEKKNEWRSRNIRIGTTNTSIALFYLVLLMIATTSCTNGLMVMMVGQQNGEEEEKNDDERRPIDGMGQQQQQQQQQYEHSSSSSFTEVNGHMIPNKLESSFGSYPNPLNITEDDRKSFHPVVIYPTDIDIPILNLTYGTDGLASEKERIEQRKKSSLRNQWIYKSRILFLHTINKIINTTVKILPIKTTTTTTTTTNNNNMVTTWKSKIQDKIQYEKKQQQPRGQYAIGKYDENRLGYYNSDLFQDLDNEIDGYSGQRTVHLGIDLDAPVGTKVYSFTDGIIHSSGYNSDLGDYGNVVVIQHELPLTKSTTTITTTDNISSQQQQRQQQQTKRIVWALYGHLDNKSSRQNKVGHKVKKGQIIGRIGDIYENGGWTGPHVHFQLAMHPPKTHDMPGASSIDDRPKALIEYFDPRYILGPVH